MSSINRNPPALAVGRFSFNRQIWQLIPSENNWERPEREVPLVDIRGAILTYLGCEMFNGNCFLCERDMGGCYGHLMNEEFDNDILKLVEKVNDLE